MTVVASAPGKIVLSGEYAVLSGAPAVCVAVQVRARATVTASPDGKCHVSTPGFSGQDSHAVIDAVCGGIRPASVIELDTTAFSVEGAKLGIGSSAAVTVALTAALEGSTDVSAKAMHAHAALQGGSGSGIDVAAAIHGGLIRYEMSSRSVVRLDWPDGLAMRVLWSGVPASTAAKLNRLAAQAAQPSRAVLVRAAATIAEAWQSGDAEKVLAGYPAYIDALRQFSVDHKLGIFDAGHDQLTDAAMAGNLVYKPAGAGGGDIGVFFGSDAAELDRFIAAHETMIHGVVACDLDPVGVRVESL
jgi:phosphomevalonate kinase